MVEFTTSSGSNLLNANPPGQATISRGTGDAPFTQIGIALAGGGTFTQSVFNINAATDGSVLIHVTGINIAGGFFEDDFTVDANGQNFFTVASINNQFIKSISLAAINGATFADLRPVRLGGVDITPVPEPATMSLLGGGLASMIIVVRRKLNR